LAAAAQGLPDQVQREQMEQALVFQLFQQQLAVAVAAHLLVRQPLVVLVAGVIILFRLMRQVQQDKGLQVVLVLELVTKAAEAVAALQQWV
jgi:hypothetical protein